MSSIFSDVLGMLGKWGGSGVGALGSLGSIISSQQTNAMRKKQEDLLNYYSKHPEVQANLVKGYTQPLSSGLTTGVGNVVQAQMAERGLNQAPGIYQQVSEQALAPYQLQEQQLATAMAANQMGIPIEILSALQGQGGTANFGGIQALLSKLQKPITPGPQAPAMSDLGITPTGGIDLGSIFGTSDLGISNTGGIDLGGLLGGAASTPTFSGGGIFSPDSFGS